VQAHVRSWRARCQRRRAVQMAVRLQAAMRQKSAAVEVRRRREDNTPSPSADEPEWLLEAEETLRLEKQEEEEGRKE
jgi:hypothetical protein